KDNESSWEVRLRWNLVPILRRKMLARMRRPRRSTGVPCPSAGHCSVARENDDVEGRPEFFERDTVAGCGPTLMCEFARSLNLTDMHSGWVHTRAIRNNAHTHIRAVIVTALEQIPYEATGVDNASEFSIHDH